jgi:RNA polymerase sigma-70 factor, ECF subfamily
MPAATSWNFRNPRTEYPLSTSYREDMAAAPLTDRVPDDELLTRVAAGDALAFTELFRRRQHDVYRFAVHMTGSASTADDVVQEVFLVVMRDAARYAAGRATVAAWLCGIARNCVRQRLDRDRRLTSVDFGDDEREPGPGAAAPADPLNDLLRAERIEATRRAIRSLPVSYREAVVLCDLQELPYGDAAAALGCPIGTVRSRLHRARAMLTAKLSAPRTSPAASAARTPAAPAPEPG